MSGRWIEAAEFKPEPYDRDADGPYYWVHWTWGSVQIAVWHGWHGEWMRPWGRDGETDDPTAATHVWSDPVTPPSMPVKPEDLALIEGMAEQARGADEGVPRHPNGGGSAP